MKNKQNSIVFVTSQPAVSDLLYSHFTVETKLGQNYYVEGSMSTREGAIEFVEKTRPEIVVFFEKTAGIVSIAETVYAMRKAGARVIFISSQRLVGDLVLEALVSYGVYDIILDTVIEISKLEEIIFNPRDFKDVSIFMREIRVKDDGSSGKNFVVKGIDDFIGFSNILEDDYLIDPNLRAADNLSAYKDDSVEKKSFISRLFSENKDKPKKQKKQIQKKPQQQVAPKKIVGQLGDLE